MTALLELREKVKMIYSKNEVFIVPALKFLLAFITLTVINGQMGYMSKVDNLAIVLIAALLCSFLPTGCIIAFAALFSLLHMYALSLEIAVVGLCVYLVMFLLFFRFSPKDSLVVILTPLLCAAKIPYVMPVAMGLLGTPASAISVSCGVVVYFFISNIVEKATVISSLGAEDATEKLRMAVDGLIANKTLVVMVAAFAVTIIVVYLIRRMAVDYAWTIAMVTGGIVNLVLLLVGDLLYDTNMSVIGAILGTVLAVAVAKVLEFFRFCVDYSRTEKVQFEDDEYYYYVKAIPKMTVSAQTKTVKRINSQRRPYGVGRGGTLGARGGFDPESDTEAGSRRAGGARRTVSVRSSASERENAGRPVRRVETEHTYERRGQRQGGQRGSYPVRGAGKSVSVNSNMVSAQTDDYEELD